MVEELEENLCQSVSSRSMVRRTAGAFPGMITTFAGDLWFTLNQANAIGRMTTGGEVTSYPLPTPAAGPVGISAGPDGVWFTELLASRAGRIGVDGSIEEFVLP